MAEHSGAVLHWPAAFTTWWIEELAGMLPQALRPASVSKKSCLILAFEDDASVLLERTARRGEREINRLSMRDNDGTAGVLAGLAKRRYRKWPLILRLPSHLGLRKQVDLPLAARQDLGQLLHFELDRLTPFKAQDVRFAWRILETDSKAGRMRIALEMAPKAAIDKAVEIARRGGRDVDRVELEGGDDRHEPLNLVPPERQDTGKGGWLNRILGITTVVLLVIAAGLPIKKQLAVIDGLDAEIAALRAEAEENLTLRQRLALVSNEAGFLARAGYDRPTMTELLAELTRLLPDHSHLRQLRITKTTIELNGLAEAPSELVPILDRSPMLAAPTFSSPIVRDRQSGQDHFRISVSLAGGHS